MTYFHFNTKFTSQLSDNRYGKWEHSGSQQIGQALRAHSFHNERLLGRKRKRGKIALNVMRITIYHHAPFKSLIDPASTKMVGLTRETSHWWTKTVNL
jgi:hypothetical protein